MSRGNAAALEWFVWGSEGLGLLLRCWEKQRERAYAL